MALTKEDLQAIGDLIDTKLEEKLEQKLEEKLNAKFDEKLEPINNRLDRIEGRLDKVEGKIEKIENRLDKVESEVSSLKAGQIEIRKDIQKVDAKVSETYDIALDAWGRSKENRNWLENAN